MSTCPYQQRVRMLLLIAVTLFGCHAKTVSKADESPHLASLVKLYLQAESKLGHRPANEAELKSFIASHNQSDSLHIDSIDELFVSERDGQPFVVMYGEPANGMQSGLAAYEQIGVAGKHLVASSLGLISQVGPKKFAKLMSPGATVGK